MVNKQSVLITGNFRNIRLPRPKPWELQEDVIYRNTVNGEHFKIRRRVEDTLFVILCFASGFPKGVETEMRRFVSDITQGPYTLCK